MSIWSLEGSETQNKIIRQALCRCTFPFDVLLPGLQVGVNRDTIPVEWADLSRESALLAEAKKTGGHLHIHEAGDIGHPIEARDQVLGLAWYSGKVTLDFTVEPEPDLAGEVFLSEGAHMIDFFWMADWHRAAIWNALHPDQQDIDPATAIEDGVDLGHGHGWFDMAGYYSWVGEAWMGLFVRAYTDWPVTIGGFSDHPATDEAAAQIREAFAAELAGR